MNVKNLNPAVERVLWDRETIEARIKEQAQWVNETYKDSEEVILIGLLKGCFPFMAQLIKDITVNVKIDFIIVSSYGKSTVTSGEAKIILDTKQDLKGKDVLIVEDVVETGITLVKISEMLQARGVKSLRTIVMVDKPFRRVPFEADNVGFVFAEDRWIIGYGFDHAEKYRNLPYVGVWDEKTF